MVLKRIGNKNRIAHKIIENFPVHKIFIDMFFGAGGIFFNKANVDFNYLNDIDDDVFNLFMVLKKNKVELYEAVENTLISDKIFNYWKNNLEFDPVLKALRFLYLSNFSLYGCSAGLRYNVNNSKKLLLKNILNETFTNAFFLNVDFRQVLKKISIKDGAEKQNTFIYADPPYIKTVNNYNTKWDISDFYDLLNILENSQMKYAISELDNPEVLEIVKNKNLHVKKICERPTLRSRQTEILIMNYDNNKLFN